MTLMIDLLVMYTCFTFTLPGEAFKDTEFQQGMWGGRKPLRRIRCKIRYTSPLPTSQKP